MWIRILRFVWIWVQIYVHLDKHDIVYLGLRYCSNEVGTPQIIRSSMLNETDKVLCGKDDVGISHAVVFQVRIFY